MKRLESGLFEPTAKGLHMGCGSKILADYVNVDLVEADGVDLAWDLSESIPFPDDSFSKVLSVDFIEHIPPDRTIRLMNEVYRVLEPGGVFHVHVPESPGITASQDPTHRSQWHERTFGYFEDGNLRREDYGVSYGIEARFRIENLVRRRHGGWRAFLRTRNLAWLSNYLLDLDLVAVK